MFLSAIEDAFSSEVSATIDASGRLVVTDKYNGYSQLSISITEPTGRGLDFGTVDVTAGAGDGSQEGRYSMAITATDDDAASNVVCDQKTDSANQAAQNLIPADIVNGRVLCCGYHVDLNVATQFRDPFNRRLGYGVLYDFGQFVNYHNQLALVALGKAALHFTLTPDGSGSPFVRHGGNRGDQITQIGRQALVVAADQ